MTIFIIFDNFYHFQQFLTIFEMLAVIIFVDLTIKSDTGQHSKFLRCLERCVNSASHRHTCLLYSGCEVFTTDCEDCTTGKLECDICTFENMLPDGSCGMDFTHCFCANKKTRSWVIMYSYKLNCLLLFISALV